MSEGGEAAEIEAVARVLLDADLWLRMRMDEMPLPPDAAHDIALNILDAVRSSGSAARNQALRQAVADLEAGFVAQWPSGRRPKSDEGWMLFAQALDHLRDIDGSRSPQGEDHEAGIEAAAETMKKSWPWATRPDDEAWPKLAKYVVAAYLSRCPSPVSGTEPDTARLVEALREARPYVFNRTQGEDWRAEIARDVLERVDAALSGFSGPQEPQEKP